jgi:hypothetical protein
VLVLSGADGSLLHDFTGAHTGSSAEFGAAVAILGDLNADGFAEIAVGDPHPSRAGSVVILSIESDCDSDGFGRLGGDCDDAEAAASPGVADPCDGLFQNDCVPGDGTSEAWFGLPCDGEDSDACREGEFQCPAGSRWCDDLSSNSVEVCNDVDDDCNGLADDVACPDYDVDDDEQIGGVELAWLGRAFASCSADPGGEWWGRIDYTKDGCIDGDDLVVLANLWQRRCSGGNVECRDE